MVCDDEKAPGRAEHRVTALATDDITRLCDARIAVARRVLLVARLDRPPELLDLVLAGLDAEWRRRKVQCEEELEAAERAATS